jgi:phospholipase C
LGNAASGWTACDNYFAAIMAETYPNRFYQHAAQSDRIHNSTAMSSLPTIWDELQAVGLTSRYYFSDVPFLALWGAKYVTISRPFTEFLFDCAAGNLPQVSFIDPRFEDETSGTSSDDHPHADIRNGEAFLNQIYSAVTRGPGWEHTLLIINFDEWGGFFDHVPPPTAPIPVADRAAGNQDGRLFRLDLCVQDFVSNDLQTRWRRYAF